MNPIGAGTHADTSSVARAATQAYPFSARELQAAAAALVAGRFSDAGDDRPGAGFSATVQAAEDPMPPAPGEATAEGDAIGGGASGSGDVREPRRRDDVSGRAPAVRVLAANAGAGASTVALALADAADAAGVRTRVLDAASPAWSGLVGATDTELGSAVGWRRGRRGRAIVLDRVQDPAQIPGEVPVPRPIGDIDLSVLDVGWSVRELAAGRGWLTDRPARVEVVVTRSHRSALSQTEAVLGDLLDRPEAGEAVVVLVGSHRLDRRDLATAGRRLRDLFERDGVVPAPLLSAKALPTLGPGPLPKPLMQAAERLMKQITGITGPLSAARI